MVAEITLNRKEFLLALQAAALGVSTRSTLPCLGKVGLETDGRHATPRIRVVGTDLETTVEASLPCAKTWDEFVAGMVWGFLTPKSAIAALRKAPKGEEDVVLEHCEDDDGSTVVLRCGKARYEEKAGFDPEEAPHFSAPWDDNPEEYTVRLSEAQLEEVVRRVLHAAKKPEMYAARPLLEQVLLEPCGTGVRFVATDRYRLSRVTVADATTGVEGAAGEPAMLPAALMRLVPKVLKKPDDRSAGIEVRERYVGVHLARRGGLRPEVVLRSRRFDVVSKEELKHNSEAKKPEFAPYRRIYPKGEPQTVVDFAAAGMRQALEYVLVVDLVGSAVMLELRDAAVLMSAECGSQRQSFEVEAFVAKAGCKRCCVSGRLLLSFCKAETDKSATLIWERDWLDVNEAGEEKWDRSKNVLRMRDCGAGVTNDGVLMGMKYFVEDNDGKQRQVRYE